MPSLHNVDQYEDESPPLASELKGIKALVECGMNVDKYEDDAYDPLDSEFKGIKALVECGINADQYEDEAYDPLVSDFKGIKALVESGMNIVPTKYLMPHEDAIGIADIPTVNMSSPTIMHDFHHACSTSGMFYLANHGVEIESVMNSVLEFFKLPHEMKMKLWTEQLFDPVRYCTSMTPSLETRLEWHDHLQMWVGENEVDSFKFPDNPQELGEHISNYVKGLLSLGNELLRLMSKGLGLDEQAMKNAYGRTVLLMRANYYPPCPNPNMALGMDGHTDSGGITFLAQDDVGGLQVKQDGQWREIVPKKGTFVVNMGDQIEKLTNGQYKSILHRVMVHPSKYRVSIASFASPFPDPTIDIAPIPELLNEKNPSKYTRMPYKDYINEVYTKHFAGKNVY